MDKASFGRLAVILLCAAALLAGGALAALHFAGLALKERIEQALGPESEVAEIVLGWSAVEIRGISIRAPQGWPAMHALRAERVVLRPDLFALLSARIHVPSITVDKAYVSVWRSRDGRLRLLPSLLERRPEASGAPPAVSIGRIALTGGVMDFFDGTVRRPAHRTRLEQMKATVEELHLPAMAGRTTLQLEATVKGVRRDGRLQVAGWAELAERNSEITTRLQDVDLLALQPYLIKASETGVRRGTLDMQLKSTVRANRLHAPGSMTLTGLELAPGDSPFATFMGVPRSAVLAALKDRKDRITVAFTLEGRLDDPRFSLNDSLATRIGGAVADGLGISFEGLTRGVGSAAEGIGGMVKKLFGQ